MVKITEDHVGRIFTTNGNDVWRMTLYYERPMAHFENLETGEVVQGPIHSPLVQKFSELVVMSSKHSSACKGDIDKDVEKHD